MRKLITYVFVTLLAALFGFLSLTQIDNVKASDPIQSRCGTLQSKTDKSNPNFAFIVKYDDGVTEDYKATFTEWETYKVNERVCFDFVKPRSNTQLFIAKGPFILAVSIHILLIAYLLLESIKVLKTPGR